MSQRINPILLSILALTLASCASTLATDRATADAKSPRQHTLIDADWRFHLGDITPNTQVITADYDDAQWQHVDVPHDYVLGNDYKKSDVKAERGHGYLTYDVGWYRKHLTIPDSARGKIITLDFDGVFRNSEVFFNGQSLGTHRSGYTPFSYDISKLAKYGADNIIAVRVDPREFEGWWYEGGGIYRHVYLTEVSPLHITQFGTYVMSTVPNGDQGADDTANIAVETRLENSAAAPIQNCKIVCEFLDPAGNSIKTIETQFGAVNNGESGAIQNTTIDHPKLWSPQSPNLYQLRTTILQDNKPIDATTTTFGIRTIRFDKDKGFFLNGQHVLIQGAAARQDVGGLGIAVPDSIQPWRVKTLQASAGANGWRTAHNEPNEAVLDACDRAGMMVMAENRHLGDAYTHHTKPGATATDLSDLATMIQRDRNHPSIIMWSMCNEEGLQGSPEGVAIFKNMMDVVHRYDKTRPITSAMNNGFDAKHSFATVEDIIGINYHDKEYDAIRKAHPDKCLFGSESQNQKTTRGEYADNKDTGMCSAYNVSERQWQAVAERPYMAGSFTWTGFDYRGEPNPFGWPDVSNNTGLLDLAGFPKDKFYYFKSCWTDQPMVHIVPSSWNWKTGDPIRVLAWSNAPQVELFLNGQSLGIKEVPKASHAEWQVPFAAGELTAKAINNGKIVATDTLQTTGATAHIKLTVDRTTLTANAEDAVVVAVSLLDDKGRVVPNDDRRIKFEVTGSGKILGVNNGNPADHDSDRADNRNTFHGHCIAIVEAGDPGELRVTASSPNVTSDSLKFKVR